MGVVFLDIFFILSRFIKSYACAWCRRRFLGNDMDNPCRYCGRFPLNEGLFCGERGEPPANALVPLKRPHVRLPLITITITIADTVLPNEGYMHSSHLPSRGDGSFQHHNVTSNKSSDADRVVTPHRRRSPLHLTTGKLPLFIMIFSCLICQGCRRGRG